MASEVEEADLEHHLNPFEDSEPYSVLHADLRRRRAFAYMFDDDNAPGDVAGGVTDGVSDAAGVAANPAVPIPAVLSPAAPDDAATRPAADSPVPLVPTPVVPQPHPPVVTDISQADHFKRIIHLLSHPSSIRRLRQSPPSQFVQSQSVYFTLVIGTAIRFVGNAPFTSEPAALDDSPGREGKKLSYWPAIQAYLASPSGPPPIVECSICWKDIKVHGIPPRTLEELDPPSGRGVALPCGHVLCNECMETYVRIPLGNAPLLQVTGNGLSIPEGTPFPGQLGEDQNLVQHPHPPSNRTFPPTSITLSAELKDALINLVAMVMDGKLTRPYSPPCLEQFFRKQPPAAVKCPSCSHSINFKGCWHTTRGVPLPFDCPSEDLIPCARIPPIGSPIPHVCDSCALHRLRLWLASMVEESLWSNSNRGWNTVEGKRHDVITSELRLAMETVVLSEWRKRDQTRT
ncbi:hypothetical protein QBC34DRAFT_415378, partial [Podospora aff. communis PSN243]